jgi:ubiquinone/menaquinone biosynthesis C-methylase UbiE
MTTPWDAYAPFYDWENARTFGRRDVAFWRRIVRRERGRVLELGCGTGRLLMPLARAGIDVTGIDFAGAMLARAGVRARRLPSARRPALVQGDVRALPFADGAFGVVLASYGFLQSIIQPRDLTRALDDVARVVVPGGLFGIDLVPDLPRWSTYRRRVSLRGRAARGAIVTLVETVRQDRRRHLTMFDETFVVRRGGATERRDFTLTFRTLPMADTLARVRRAGFRVEAVLGDYRGGPWRPDADVWVVLARRVERQARHMEAGPSGPAGKPGRKPGPPDQGNNALTTVEAPAPDRPPRHGAQAR